MSESAPVVKVRCPACNKPLGFPQASAGRKARCPGCQHTFRVELPPVPVQALERAIPGTPPASDRLTVNCPSCNKTLRLPASANGRKAQCPACDERFTVSAQHRLAELAPALKQATNDDGLLDSLANAESSAQALAEQPALPADFKVRELTPLKPEPAERAPSGGGGRRSVTHDREGKGATVERAYSAMGTLVKGCAFSAAGALIGAFIWYGIAKAFSIELGYVAWGVGLLAGLGMHVGVRSESALAGCLAAVFAFGGILAGKLMFVAWVMMPVAEAEMRKEMNSIEHQRSVLVSQESERILRAKNINPDEATEAQEEAAEREAQTRITKLSDTEARQGYQKYIEEHPEAASNPKLMPSLREMPTGLLVLLVGLLFGLRGLIFVILGMATAFKVGYNGGRFGQ